MQKAAPFQDLKKQASLSDEQMKKLKLFGVWIFADSDNSDSSSNAYLAEIKLKHQ